jgi:hypothetical protein
MKIPGLCTTFRTILRTLFVLQPTLQFCDYCWYWYRGLTCEGVHATHWRMRKGCAPLRCSKIVREPELLR